MRMRQAIKVFKGYKLACNPSRVFFRSGKSANYGMISRAQDIIISFRGVKCNRSRRMLYKRYWFKTNGRRQLRKP